LKKEIFLKPIKNSTLSKLIVTHSTLKEAKKVCRGLGHTEENNRFLTGYPPVAYVSDGEGVVYTPRFKK
jgi:hypothetical protein